MRRPFSILDTNSDITSPYSPQATSITTKVFSIKITHLKFLNVLKIQYHQNQPDCCNRGSTNWLAVNKALMSQWTLGIYTIHQPQCKDGQSNPAFESWADEWKPPPFNQNKTIFNVTNFKFELISEFFFLPSDRFWQYPAITQHTVGSMNCPIRYLKI